MAEKFNLEEYLTSGVEKIVAGAVKATLKNPKESLFMAKYALASKKASKLRKQAEENGEHIPPFLIASVTSQCNLHCAGCYSRGVDACVDSPAKNQLTTEQWNDIFKEAESLGIGFVLMVGGEPLVRTDVIEAAAKIPNVMFPIFTNATLIGESYVKVFDQHRNLVPILSIEGNKESTDKRRGEGIYEKLTNAMELLKKKQVPFGTSITVTTENMKEVTSYEFLDQLYDQGCKVVIYVEYVPVTEESKKLAPGETERLYLDQRLTEIRAKYEDMVYISFPGDEKSSGGCLAAGRGFFHINSHGGAEPCPFSPYSDMNVKDHSLKEALQSKLFQGLRDNNILMEEHMGGCTLFEKKDVVEELLRTEK
ncbi:radical SAM, pyruvate-formate lyase-activating enzyme like [Lachnospiraceae bacterium KM106-2]|nr:radical SAM, pyruvate-formate lyase-activating enzyme like [Lachnospiraceae bacterium KM106-2]